MGKLDHNGAAPENIYTGNYKIRYVDKKMGLSGVGIKFINEDFFGLKVGQKVIQIGCGKENGTIRTDIFNYPLQYCGSIELEFKKDNLEKCYAFKLPNQINNEDIFLIYLKTEQEIFTEAIYSTKNRETGKVSTFMRFYQPKFTIV